MNDVNVNTSKRLEGIMTDHAMSRPRLVVVDMALARRAPAGSCVLEEVRGLAQTFDVTVFSDSCEAAGEPGVTWFRLPVPGRPILLRYVLFHMLLPLRVALWRLAGGRAERVQCTQGQLPGSDVVYAHFCHAAYLKGAWGLSTVSGPRRWARWLNHQWNAWYEARAMRRAKTVVVPSLGLQRELSAEYPEVASRIVRIPNPVDTARFAPDPSAWWHAGSWALVRRSWYCRLWPWGILHARAWGY
jgi:hypothetical protein